MAVLASDRHQRAAILVENDRCRRGVPVVHIMRNLLRIPEHMSGIRVEHDNRIGVQVLSRTCPAIEVRAGISERNEKAAGAALDGDRGP
jgi:hypothetical protein